MSDSIFFNRDLENIGFQNVTILEDDGNHYQFISARYTGRTGPETVHVLYLKSGAKEDVIGRIKDYLSSKYPGHVKTMDVVVGLRHPLRLNLEEIARLLKFDISESKRCVRYETYLKYCSGLSSQLSNIDPKNINFAGLEYFIDTEIQFVNSDQKVSALSVLHDWLLKREEDPRLAVILGPGGSGKTTVARALCKKILNMNFPRQIPILIESEQWRQYLHRSDITLYEIWEESFKTLYDTTFNRNAMDTCLSNGVIIPIFDGFDELCSQYGDNFDANLVLEKLLSLFTEGRILLTSREQFWYDNVSKPIANQITQIKLYSFSSQQRGNYLTKRFKGHPHKINFANTIFSAIDKKLSYGKKPSPAFNRGTELFVNLPIIIEMVCEICDRIDKYDQDEFFHVLDRDDPIFFLINQYCKRESIDQRRSRLSPEQQFQLMTILAVECGPGFQLEDLEMCAEMVKKDLKESDKRQLRTYTYFTLPLDPQRRTFRFPFLASYLVARAIYKWVFEHEMYSKEITKPIFYVKAFNDNGGIKDYLADIIRDRKDDNWKSKLKDQWNLSNLSNEERSGLMQIIVQLCSELARKDVTLKPDRKEATDSLISIIGDSKLRTISGIEVSGEIRDYDFSNTVFEKCAFADIHVVRCLFSNTRFVECEIRGKFNPLNCDGLTTVDFSGFERLSREAADTINNITSRPTAAFQTISNDLILEAIKEALKPFLKGSRLVPIKHEDRFNSIRIYPFKDLVWKTLIEQDVIREKIDPDTNERSGWEVDPDNIEAATAVHQLLEHNYEGGKVKKVYDLLIGELLPKSN